MVFKPSDVNLPCPATSANDRMGGAIFTRAGKLEALRKMAAALVAQMESADPLRRASLLLQVRRAQDQISAIKHRSPMTTTARRQPLDWVDDWSPSH